MGWVSAIHGRADMLTVWLTNKSFIRHGQLLGAKHIVQWSIIYFLTNICLTEQESENVLSLHISNIDALWVLAGNF